MAQQVPLWTKELPKTKNNTYVYVCEWGIGGSVQEAYNNALTKVFQSTANRIGQPFDSRNIKSALEHGTSLEVISSTYRIPINKVCDYSEQIDGEIYRVYVLCQVAINALTIPQWSNYSQCNDLGGEGRNGIAALKSIFIPGFGQMGKRRYSEGALTLAGELVLVGGAVGCYYGTRNQLEVMRNPEVDYESFIAARRSYNTMRTTSYICWGTAAALYIFNIVRAATAKPRYKENKVVFVPATISSPEYIGVGVNVTYRF